MIDLALSAQVLIWAVVLGLFLWTGESSLFHPLAWYLAFHVLVFVLRPILVHAFGFDFLWNYMAFQPTPEIFVTTLAVSSAGLIAFSAACLGFSRTGPVPSSRRQAPDFSPQHKKSLLVVTLLLLPAIAYSIGATRHGYGGELVGGVYVNRTSIGYLNDAQFAIMPLLCAWLAVTRFRWINVVPAVLYIGYRTWFGWARFTIVLFVALVVIVYCWQRGRRWMPVWSLAVAVPLFLLFNLIGQNRDLLKQYFAGEEVRTLDLNPGLTHEERLKARFDNQDAANFDSLAYIVAVVPQETGTYTYGSQYLQIFTEPIPRLLWKGKPVGAPVVLFDLNAYGNFIGLTPSLVGDGWMSGGWIGLIVTMALAGGLLGYAHRWFWKNVDNSMAALFYLTGLPMLAQWYRDGGISMAKFMLWNWLPLLMWLVMQWLMSDRRVPAYSMELPRHTRLRFRTAK